MEVKKRFLVILESEDVKNAILNYINEMKPNDMCELTMKNVEFVDECGDNIYMGSICVKTT